MQNSHPSVIFAASVPPPITGQSLAGLMLLRFLESREVDCRVLNLSRPFHGRPRFWSELLRALAVCKLPPRLLRTSLQLRGRSAVFYLQLGQSHKALIRDLPLLKIASVRNLPVVLHVHGSRFRHALDTAPGWLRNSIESELRHVEGVVVLSSTLREMFAELVPPTKVTVVPNPVDDRLVDAATKVETPRFKSSCHRVLFLSNFLDSKGVLEVLITALIAKREGLSFHFVMAGARTDSLSIDPAKYVAENQLSNVELVGPVDMAQKVELLSSSDIFLLPTRNEGLPLVLIEALYFGLPIVTSPIGGIPELIKDGRNGFLVPPIPEALLNALKRVAADPARRELFWRQNRKDALNFSEAIHGERMLEIFHAASGDLR